MTKDRKGICIDCKNIADKIYEEVQNQMEVYDRVPPITLAVISSNDDPASKTYVNSKMKACAKVGFGFRHYIYSPATMTETLLSKLLRDLNADPDVCGIIIQEPFYIGDKKINLTPFVNIIQKYKDVDGFTDSNRLALVKGEKPTHLPCTVAGIINVIHEWETLSNDSIEGKTIMIAGRSKIVGAPLYDYLRDKGVTLISINSHTTSEQKKILAAKSDIIISAVGMKDIFNSSDIWDRKCKLFIDVGINSQKDEYTGKNTLIGDCSEYAKSNYCEYYTSVPGGIGLLTVANLIKNTFNAYLLNPDRDED